MTVNEYLSPCVETAIRRRVRAKTFRDYQGMLRRHVRPTLGERVLAGMRPLDLQSMYHQMSERGLSCVFATQVGFDRDRVFYPTRVAVIARY